MALYARPSRTRRRQVTADLLVLGWTILWALVGVEVWRRVMAAAEPARRVAESVTRMQNDLASASGDVGGIPVAGEQLRRPFDSAAGSMRPIVEASQDQVRTLEQLAVLLGLLAFILPVALVLTGWLPVRLRFVRRSREVTRLLDSGADLDLLALRALATQPVRTLARIDPDPLGQWRAGHWATIVRLADLELAEAGVGLPRELRDRPPDRFADES
ncbi:hypothetical protein AADG42_12510 [Ammonicoccus fulvus]|uniref:Uncharacterized protein n=1 Tax=Ammonicoccus fulvus TaxID=3138240 RepID=A0ABZ3FPT5_9ACTN